MNDEDRQEVAAVRTWYDRTAEAFDERYAGAGGEFWESFEERVAMDLLGTPLNRILDLGCGPGRLASSLAACATEVLGVDLSPAMIFIANEKPHPRTVRYTVMDGTRAALASESVDAVISLGMFEYLADPSPFLAEIRRILRPGGQLVLTCHHQPPVVFDRLMSTARFAKRALMSTKGPKEADSRQGFPRTVQHQPGAMLKLLQLHGFVEGRFRGFHFSATVRMYRAAGVLKFVAARMDRWLGRMPGTRALAPLGMYSARKRR